MNKVLEIDTDPDIKTSNKMAIPLSVLKAFSQELSQLYAIRYGISISFYEGKMEFNAPPFSLWKCFDCIICDSYDFIEEKNIIDTLIRMIYNDKFVCLPINERYIPLSNNYSKFDYFNEILIYGYDIYERCFYTAFSNDSQQYKTYKISFNHIEKAFYESNNTKLENVIFFEPKKIPYDLKFLFLQDAVKELVKYFNDDENFALSDCIYGNKVYDILVNQINSENINVYDFKIFYEQKNQILNFFEVAVNGIAAEKYRRVVENMGMLLDSVSHIKENVVDQKILISMLNKVKEKESTTLMNILV